MHPVMHIAQCTRERQQHTLLKQLAGVLLWRPQLVELCRLFYFTVYQLYSSISNQVLCARHSSGRDNEVKGVVSWWCSECCSCSDVQHR
jgi:hypothetical protein